MNAYQVFNRFFDIVNRLSPILILTPYARNIGNCAEEVYYGLLKARREGKKALFIYPRPLFWKFRPEVANVELLKVESEYSIPNDGLFARALGCALTVIFTFSRYAYLWYMAFRRRLDGRRPLPEEGRRNNVYYVQPSIGRAALWGGAGGRFSWDEVAQLDWRRQHEEYLDVRLNPEKKRRAERIRAEMGLPLDCWFACLHVRESGFHNDDVIGAHRNASIANYFEAIKAVTGSGGYVVRLGDPSMSRLAPMEKVIDYPHTRFKSELMDLYLVAECRFYIGMNSGPLDVAWLFQKNVVLANLTEYVMSFPKHKGDLAITKHIFSRSRDRFLSLDEALDEPFAVQGAREIGRDYVMLENTSMEIKDLVEEYLSGRDGYSGLQESFNRRRGEFMACALGAPGRIWSPDVFDDAVERFRFASRIDSCSGAIGKRFVEENWSRGSVNVARLNSGTEPMRRGA